MRMNFSEDADQPSGAMARAICDDFDFILFC
jgi:hypothetical protein